MSFLKYLYSYPVLVHGQNLASGVSIQLWQQNAEGGSVAGEGLVRDEVVWNVLSPQLQSRLACRQGICLCEEVAHQLIVVRHHLTLQVTLPVKVHEHDAHGREHPVKPCHRSLQIGVAPCSMYACCRQSTASRLLSSSLKAAHNRLLQVLSFAAGMKQCFACSMPAARPRTCKKLLCAVLRLKGCTEVPPCYNGSLQLMLCSLHNH